MADWITKQEPTTNDKCWKGYREKGTLVGMQIVAATMENSMRFLKKLKIELPYDPSIPLLGINLEKMKTLI